jgi:RNA polymerase primary sigma factor
MNKAQEVARAFKLNRKELTKRESEIVKYYYGIGVEFRCTLQELGSKFQVTRERIRQIKAAALNKIGAVI